VVDASAATGAAVWVGPGRGVSGRVVGCVVMVRASGHPRHTLAVDSQTTLPSLRRQSGCSRAAQGIPALRWQ